MSQEDNPRFSHITVGTTASDGSTVSEDEEEVIAIGAIGVPSVSLQEANRIHPQETDSIEAGEQVASEVIQGQTVDVPSNESDEDELFGGPMPFMQKMVIVACAIGLVVVIVFLIWFWNVQR